MARLPRLQLAGCAQHVIQRGNNRAACFYHAADYRTYLAFLLDAALQHQVAVHAFVLMTNHVHLLVTPADEQGISLMMQALGRKYVQYFNVTYSRTGTLWEGRYRSTLVDSEHYLLKVYRYIELNPVRAQLVSHAARYPWSSYQGNALGKAIRLLTPHPAYLSLGQNDTQRHAAYQALFAGLMPESDIQAIRAATNKSWVLGDAAFKAEVSARTGRRSEPCTRGGDRKSASFRRTD